MTDPAHDRPLLRVGAVLAVGGVLPTLGYAVAHPAREGPADRPRVFLEYAHNDALVAVHLARSAGFLAAFGARIASTSTLSLRWPTAAALARLGLAGTVAAGVRWLEIALNAHFRLVRGATALLFGAPLAVDGRFTRWLGWVGAVVGVGLLARGLAVTAAGFALSNPVHVGNELFRALLYLWLLALAATMWRHGRRSPWSPDAVEP